MTFLEIYVILSPFIVMAMGVGLAIYTIRQNRKDGPAE